jgi:hypothetical protein
MSSLDALKTLSGLAGAQLLALSQPDSQSYKLMPGVCIAIWAILPAVLVNIADHLVVLFPLALIASG